MKNESTVRPESSSLARKLLGIVTSSWMSQATYVAAQLRVPDLLADGPKTTAELAKVTGTHAPALYRLMRALTTVDVFAERDDGSFDLTPMGSLLRSDVPGSLRSWTIFWGGYLWPVWGHLLHSVKTGESARKLLTGTEEFQHLEQDREAAAIFNRAMVELTRLVADGVAQRYDFSQTSRIVDVGGGYGELLVAILRASPQMSGVLFDLPHAIDDARGHFEKEGARLSL